MNDFMYDGEFPKPPTKYEHLFVERNTFSELVKSIGVEVADSTPKSSIMFNFVNSTTEIIEIIGRRPKKEIKVTFINDVILVKFDLYVIGDVTFMFDESEDRVICYGLSQKHANVVGCIFKHCNMM